MRSTLPTFNEVWQRQFWSSILKQFQDFSENTTFLIGCSGGLDSMLLLHLMSFLCPQKIRAIYIDHQLQDLSQSWAQFVSTQAEQLEIPVYIEKVTVASGNLESQAREARYQAFQKYLQPNDVLVLAHHQQDQAETLMLRLLSGAGVQGLSAMHAWDEREHLKIWRPLLDISREQICQWAAQLDIQHIEDPTNQDKHYDRAWCRLDLWPMLQQRFPKMQQALSRTSYLMQDADEILNEVFQQDLTKCGDSFCLGLAPLAQLSDARQRQLLSGWMKGYGDYRPSFDMVRRLQTEVILSKPDAQAVLHWNQYYYVRYRSKLYRLSTSQYLPKQVEPPYSNSIQVALNEIITLSSGAYIIDNISGCGLAHELLAQTLCIHLREGGEKIHLHGRVGAWPLKKAIQEAHIFPWQRHTIQILSIDNVMLGVFTPKGFWLAESRYLEHNGWLPKLVSQR